MGRASQKKGNAGQVELARELYRLTGTPWPYKPKERPDQGYQLPPALSSFHVEVKRVERIRIWEALDQAAADAKRGGLEPLLAFRRNRGKWKAAVDLELLVHLLRTIE